MIVVVLFAFNFPKDHIKTVGIDAKALVQNPHSKPAQAANQNGKPWNGKNPGQGFPQKVRGDGDGF